MSLNSQLMISTKIIESEKKTEVSYLLKILKKIADFQNNFFVYFEILLELLCNFNTKGNDFDFGILILLKKLIFSSKSFSSGTI